jgi:hypothetical protein
MVIPTIPLRIRHVHDGVPEQTTLIEDARELFDDRAPRFAIDLVGKLDDKPGLHAAAIPLNALDFAPESLTLLQRPPDGTEDRGSPVIVDLRAAGPTPVPAHTFYIGLMCSRSARPLSRPTHHSGPAHQAISRSGDRLP